MVGPARVYIAKYMFILYIFKDIRFNNPIIKNKYLSVHFVILIKNDRNLFFKKIATALYRYDIKTIYIASDDYDFYGDIENKFPNNIIIRKTFFEKNLYNLHYGHPQEKNKCMTA